MPNPAENRCAKFRYFAADQLLFVVALSMLLTPGLPVAPVVEVTQTPDGIKIDHAYVAADVGRIIDPINFENQVQGGVIWGWGMPSMPRLHMRTGKLRKRTPLLPRACAFYQTPDITVERLENAIKIRGIGAPPYAPAAPALANAIFAATGQRIREMPFNRHIAFV